MAADSLTDDSDFFDFGAGSMDTVRLIEEIKQRAKKAGCFKYALKLSPDDVVSASTLARFVNQCARGLRGLGKPEPKVDTVDVEAENGVLVRMPHQLFINGKFVDAKSKETYETIDPTTERPICSVALGAEADVDKAVKAAAKAFDKPGGWREMSARDRGALLTKLAQAMEEAQEELATIESMDSGAVYTLALKTHVGMSIQSFAYFAGWCDKIEGRTIPISHSRPSSNLCLTRREPFGVVGLVVPWVSQRAPRPGIHTHCTHCTHCTPCTRTHLRRPRCPMGGPTRAGGRPPKRAEAANALKLPTR